MRDAILDGYGDAACVGHVKLVGERVRVHEVLGREQLDDQATGRTRIPGRELAEARRGSHGAGACGAGVFQARAIAGVVALPAVSRRGAMRRAGATRTALRRSVSTPPSVAVAATAGLL